MYKRVLTFFGGVLFGTLLFASQAGAVTINPPILEFRVDPGGTVEDIISVFNDSADSRMTLTPDIVNFTYKEGDETTGTPVFYSADEMKTGYELAAWLEMDMEEMTVFPLVKKTVPFSISVPKNASPGSYFGAIIFRSATHAKQGEVGLSSGTAVLIILRVNGVANESGSLTDFTSDDGLYSHLPANFTARVENNGNVLLQPAGTVTVTDVFGRQVGVVEINPELRGILPGSARRFVAQWGNDTEEEVSELGRQWNNFKFGKFTASLNMKYGSEGKAFTATHSFWVVPWLVIVVLGGGLVALIFVAAGILKWYERRVIRRFESSRDGS